MQYVNVVITTANGATSQFYTAKDIVIERKKLRRYAEAILRRITDQTIRHIVYYSDERSESGQLKKAYFYYNPICLTDDQFYGKWDLIQGLVGAVHR